MTSPRRQYLILRKPFTVYKAAAGIAWLSYCFGIYALVIIKYPAHVKMPFYVGIPAIYSLKLSLDLFTSIAERFDSVDRLARTSRAQASTVELPK